jgi:hypothetical protein
MITRGITDDPTPTPINPEPASVSTSVGGTTLPITAMPALRNTVPARTK